MDKNFKFRFTVVIVLLFFAFTLRMFVVGPPAVDAEHRFQTDRAFARLTRILGSEAPHPVDSLANDFVRDRLVGEIRSLGFSPVIRDDFHCTEGRESMRCARVRNVMFWIGEPGANAVMIASHYDSVPAGPGAGDDGAGVAASLEISALLKDKELARPVLVLITDGEEVGLVGAASFVDKDPFAKLVSAVVSMEARGVSGPVAMFQTSTPNGRDIGALKSDIKSAFTNSLAADVYEVLPNDTDVTKYLKLDIDVSNFAIGGSPEFYHTPRDNLAMLDKRSFFHMGVSALNTVEAYLEQTGDEPEQQWIYTDIYGLVVVALPQLFGLPLIVLGGLAALSVFFVKGSGFPFRSLTFPFLAILLGVGLAVCVTLAIAALRPEAHYAAAHPWALRAAQISAALLGALLALMFLGRLASSQRLLMSSWACLALLSGALSFFFPGAAILFIPALIVMTLSCVLVLFDRHKIAKRLSLFAALLFLAMIVPVSALVEMMLFLEYAAPFSIFTVFCFALTVPHVLPSDGLQDELTWRAPAAGLCALILFIVAAVVVPAYSPSAPRGLSLIHITDIDASETQFGAFTNSDPMPSAMTTVVPFSKGTISGYETPAYVAPAPNFETLGLDVKIERDERVGDERLVTMQIEALDSDIVTGRIKEDEVLIESMTLNGVDKTERDTKSFSCHGRSCRSLSLTLRMSVHEPAVSLQFRGIRYGLGTAPGTQAQALLSARPDSVLARGWGDIRLLTKMLKLK